MGDDEARRVAHHVVAEFERVARLLAAGAAAGVAASVVNNPFDVVKSRAQVAAAAGLDGHALAADFGAVARRGPLWSDLRRIATVEGPLALWRGFGAKVARLAPGSAIIFTVNDAVLRALATSSAS